MVAVKWMTGVLCGLAMMASGMAWAADQPTSTAQARPLQAAVPAGPPPGAGGPLDCLRCHNYPPVNLILQTPMGVKGDPRTPMGQNGCASCHGASLEHMQKNGAVEPAVVFKGPHASPVKVRIEVCLSCHQGGARMQWQTASAHAKNDVACDTCHNPHAKKDPMRVRTEQPQICFTCHVEQRVQANRPSHHPIIEGKVICSDCHNPHGSNSEKMLVKDRVTDTCYKCHADKRGPFLYEHAPVREDCTLCHTPHGSTQDRLLKIRLPYLCQECHDTSHHSGSPYNGATFPGGLAPAVQNAFRSCENCHSQIHGSNSPSGGNFLR